MCNEDLSPAPQGSAALLYQSRILADLSNGHACVSQPVDEVDPAEMQLTVDPPIPTIACHAGHQPLRLVPTESMDAAPRPGGEFTYMESLRHRLSARRSLRTAPIKDARAHSMSREKSARRLCETFAASGKDTRDHFVAARVVIKEISRQANRGISDSVKRLRAQPDLVPVGDSLLIDEPRVA
jgi:hypothetical protein